MAEEAKKQTKVAPKNVELKMVQLMWASLAEPNKHNDNPKYEVEMQNLSKENVALLKTLDPEYVPNDGAKRMNKQGEPLTHKGLYCTPRSTRPVPVYDSTPKKMTLDEVATIGNESVGNVTVHSYSYNVSGNKGVALGLDSVQIFEMKVYNDCSFGPIEGGHVSPEAEPVTEDNVPY